MSATPKKIAQPRNSQPSTLMPPPLPSSVCCQRSPRRSMTCPDPDRLALLRVTSGPDFRVMQVEGRPLGPDARDGSEVVPGRRARGRPLQRVRVTPRVVDLDLL